MADTCMSELLEGKYDRWMGCLHERVFPPPIGEGLVPIGCRAWGYLSVAVRVCAERTRPCNANYISLWLKAAGLLSVVAMARGKKPQECGGRLTHHLLCPRGV